jgi:plastocyanin
MSNSDTPFSTPDPPPMPSAVVDRRTLLRCAGASGLVRLGPTPAHAALPERARLQGARTWRVKVGWGSADGAVAFNAFMPEEITISAGDSIAFEWGPGFHTVSFLSGQPLPPLIITDEPEGTPGASPANESPKQIFNPDVILPSGAGVYDGQGFVNSGVLAEGDVFLVTFSTAGVYRYSDIAHNAVMQGRVIVEEPGRPLPATPEEVDEDVAVQVANLGAPAAALISRYDVPAGSVWSWRGETPGATLWEVTAGAGVDQVEVLRFLPAELEVSVGDTVRWTHRALSEAHTVTFAGGQPLPETVFLEESLGGPPVRVLSPALRRSGSSVYGGTGYANSGFLGEEFGFPQAYELTFDTPGTFPYLCLPHQAMGMTGTIIVRSR